MAAAKKRLGRGLGNLISGGGAAPARPTQPEPTTGQSQEADDARASTSADASAATSADAPKAAPTKVPATSNKAATTPDKAAATPDHVPSAPVASADSSPPPVGDYREISVAKIQPSPYQARRNIDPEHVRELAESIRSEGLLQPIVVRQIEKGHYELIAGERRWRAHQFLGIQKIIARVMKTGDASSAVISLIENLQRQGLNPVEEALGYASLMSDFDLTQESVAERVGKARTTVANALRLLQLDREVQGYLAQGMLSVGHAKVLLGIESPAHRSMLARRVVEELLSVRDLERLARKLRAEDSSNKRTGPSTPEAERTVITTLEKELSSRLNTRVQLKHTPKKGRIVIEYYGNEDLQRILEKTGLQ